MVRNVGCVLAHTRWSSHIRVPDSLRNEDVRASTHPTWLCSEMRMPANNAKRTTVRAYTLRCKCGGYLRIEAPQAGLVLRCPSCDQPLSIPPLSSLRDLPSIECPRPLKDLACRPFQYRLRHLLFLMLGWAILLSIGSYVGFASSAVLLLSYLFVLFLIIVAVSSIRSFRQGTHAFWDFLERHRRRPDL